MTGFAETAAQWLYLAHHKAVDAPDFAALSPAEKAKWIRRASDAFNHVNIRGESYRFIPMGTDAT